MTGPAADLLQRHAGRLDALVRHPFFRAAADGSLSPEARDRYFTNERHFVVAAIGIFAHLLAKAPTLASTRHLVGILDGLVNVQMPLFDRIYATLSLTDPAEPPPAVRQLADRMTAVARDSLYPAGIAAMLAAEWSYAEVAKNASWRNAPDPTVREWFALHADEAFLDGVSWLGRELDASWSPDGEAEIDAAFARAIELEIAFHDDPLRA